MTDPIEAEDFGDPEDDVPPQTSSWGPTDSFNSILPVVAFVALNSYRGLKWAIVGTTIASLYAMANRYRRGLGIGVFIPAVAAVLVIRAVIGIVTDSEDVYFGTGIAVKFLIVIGLVVSVVVNRSAIGRLAPHAVPLSASTLRHEIYQSTAAGLTLMWAGYLAASAAFDVWLLKESSANGFVIIRFLVSWPISTGGTVAAMLWANRRLNRIPGFPGLASLLETRLGGPANGTES